MVLIIDGFELCVCEWNRVIAYGFAIGFNLVVDKVTVGDIFVEF